MNFQTPNMSEGVGGAQPAVVPLMALKITIPMRHEANAAPVCKAKEQDAIKAKSLLGVEEALHPFSLKADLLMPMKIFSASDDKKIGTVLPSVRLLQASVPYVNNDSIYNPTIEHPFMDALFSAFKARRGFVLNPQNLWQLMVDGVALYFHSRPAAYGISGAEQMLQRMRVVSGAADGRVRLFVSSFCKDGSPLYGSDAVSSDIQNEIVDLKMMLCNHNPFFGLNGETVDENRRGLETTESVLRTDGGSGGPKFSINVVTPRIAVMRSNVAEATVQYSEICDGGIPNYFVTGSLLDWTEMLDAVAKISIFKPLRTWACTVASFISMIVLHYRRMTPISKWPPMSSIGRKIMTESDGLPYNLQETLADFFQVAYVDKQVRIAGYSTLFFPHQIGMFDKDCAFDVDGEKDVAHRCFLDACVREYGFDMRLFRNRVCAINSSVISSKTEFPTRIMSGMIGHYLYERQNAIAPVTASFIIFQDARPAQMLDSEILRNNRTISHAVQSDILAMLWRNRVGIYNDRVRSDVLQLDNLCDFIADIDAIEARKQKQPDQGGITTQAAEIAEPVARVEKAADTAAPKEEIPIVKEPAVQSKPVASKKAVKNIKSTADAPKPVDPKIREPTSSDCKASIGVAKIAPAKKKKLAAPVKPKPVPKAVDTESLLQSGWAVKSGKGSLKPVQRTRDIVTEAFKDARDEFTESVGDFFAAFIDSQALETTKTVDIIADVGVKKDAIVAEPIIETIAPSAPVAQEESDIYFGNWRSKDCCGADGESVDLQNSLPDAAVAAMPLINNSDTEAGKKSAPDATNASALTLIDAEVVKRAPLADVLEDVSDYQRCCNAIQVLAQYVKKCIHPTAPRPVGASQHCCYAHRDASLAPPFTVARDRDWQNIDVSLHEAMTLASDTMMRCQSCYEEVAGTTLPPRDSRQKPYFHPMLMRRLPRVTQSFAEMLFTYIAWVRGGSLIHCCMFCKGEFAIRFSKAVSVVNYGVTGAGNIRVSILFHCSVDQMAPSTCCALESLGNLDKKSLESDGGASCLPTGILCTIYAADAASRKHGNGSNVRVHAFGNFENSDADLLIYMPCGTID